MKRFHSLALALGLVLLASLIWKIGPGILFNQMKTLGWGILLIILAMGVEKVFHALGWRYCLYGPHRSLPFLQVVMIRIAGYSVNQLTPTGTIGGDVSMAAMLAMANPGTEAFGSAMIGKLSHVLAQLIFVVLGSVFVALALSLPPGWWWAMTIGSILLGAGILAFFIAQKYGKSGVLFRWLVSRGFGGKALEKATRQISQVDEEMKGYFSTNNTDFLLSVFWNVVGFGCGIFQTWFFFRFMGIEASLLVVSAIWFLTIWFETASFAIPSNVGILEGTSVLTLKIANFSSALGLAYGIALRVGQIFWSLIGILCYFLLVRIWRRKRSA